MSLEKRRTNHERADGSVGSDTDVLRPGASSDYARKNNPYVVYGTSPWRRHVLSWARIWPG